MPNPNEPYSQEFNFEPIEPVFGVDTPVQEGGPTFILDEASELQLTAAANTSAEVENALKYFKSQSFAESILNEKILMATKKKAVVEKKPIALPIIPETRPDGSKRLWKTRYDELEKMFLEDEEQIRKLEEANEKLFSQCRHVSQEEHKARMEIASLKRRVMDTEVFHKRMNKFCKEFGMTMSKAPTFQDQVEEFFGNMWIRFRGPQEDSVDEIAE